MSDPLLELKSQNVTLLEVKAGELCRIRVRDNHYIYARMFDLSGPSAANINEQIDEHIANLRRRVDDPEAPAHVIYFGSWNHKPYEEAGSLVFFPVGIIVLKSPDEWHQPDDE